MSESFSDKCRRYWERFEISGSIADYLGYKGLTAENNSDGEGERTDAINN